MVSNVFLSRINLNLRKIFNRLYVFSVIKSIWVWWVPSNNISPQYLSDLVPDSLNSIHSHNTRNSSIIPPIRTRTSLFTNYFLPATIRSWNRLHERIKSSTSVNSFKSNLKSNQPHKTPYYHIGKQLGQILHSRLRMHCSSLNQHLYSKILLTPRFVNVYMWN
jgi:hypothetical protein